MPGQKKPPDAVALVSAELAALIHDVSRQLRAVAHREANLPPLPDSERDVLRWVGAHPGVSVSAVARELRMKNSNVSAAVRSLVARGLLVRDVDPADRRIARLTLTELAQQNLRRLESSWDRHISTAIDQLEPAHRTALDDAVPALRSLVEVLREARRG